MKCENCKYLVEMSGWFTCNVCDVTHRINPSSCTIVSDDDVKHMSICYNCQYWLGGGDWGLSCAKNYYHCSTNGFDEACDRFEKNTKVSDECCG